jgi:cyclophilin family peptidyl-prolyl cis-trans isomerase
MEITRAFFVFSGGLPRSFQTVRTMAMKCAASILTSVAFLCLTACEGDPIAEVREEAPRVRLKTSMGDIVIELNAEKAPITVANFLQYVTGDHYDGTVFHRVMNGFMIQGGGFAVEDGQLIEKKTGKGIKNEGQNGLKNETGTIAMARMKDLNSATAQFFINVVDNDGLDYPSAGGYAVFGKVVEGMDVVNKIKQVETGIKPLATKLPLTGKLVSSQEENVPLEPVVIESVEVVD